ncbi:MAG: dienelactone hydrolase family protein [Candidatus Bathyarchaeota archaeon]
MKNQDSNSYVKLVLDNLVLEGNLIVPMESKGIVVFAHGSGSSRFSPRNRFVAEKIQSYGLATLLFDLLTKEEEQIDLQTREYRFDIYLLSDRLNQATHWLQKNNDTKQLKIGYFGSSTGAAAALIAASKNPNIIQAVVSRGGRTDLANNYLSMVNAPTLLIVGSFDTFVLQINQETLKKLKIENKLKVISGASHLFEEPGKLEIVAKLAAEWFKEYLR